MRVKAGPSMVSGPKLLLLLRHQVARIDLIDLGGQNEIVLCQAIDGVRVHLDGHLRPCGGKRQTCSCARKRERSHATRGRLGPYLIPAHEVQVRVVAFGFGNLRDALEEVETLDKVAHLPLALELGDAVLALEKLPSGRLLPQEFGFALLERLRTAFAWHALLLCESDDILDLLPRKVLY